ncbi:mitochondrial ribosome-associated GTPase 1 isoform X1 [Theropithecus gelada]|uniref:Mitochondrial GTPase 1 n=1 Tax=Theropithecus gelada TaxID=9565 RepID=A0A8D2GI78_THEGE|nr:mitochondrial ribosome-associated GTPase 1 isoform X1 [Theropithecus gelada]
MTLVPRALCSTAQAAWRENFLLSGRDVARWFPGHMAKGLKKMKSSLKLVDCIIEVHDARIPLSGRNPLFQETLGLKPHLLVLNKMDLADLTEQQKIMQRLEGEGLKNVIFTNCLKDENVKQIIPMVTELMGSSPRYHRGENLEYCIMVIGVPNVGKSSLINSLRRQHLRKGKAARVGGEPGITRAVMSRIQVSEQPLMFLLDTPGVLAPRIESVETGLKLALCGTVLDHLVGEETMADYLLFTLNRHQRFGYVQHYGLESACDSIERVLKSVAVKLGKTQKVKVFTGTGDVNVIQPDYPAAARDFLHTFRRGLLGPMMLDLDILRGHPPAETVP